MSSDVAIVEENGLHCLVFADHDSDRAISESCYRAWFNGENVDPRLVWVGYEEIDDCGPADNDTFKCNGRRVCFSRGTFDEIKKEFSILAPSGKGRIQAVVMTIEDGHIIDKKTYWRMLGSDRISVISGLNDISISVRIDRCIEKEFSRKAAILGMSIFAVFMLLVLTLVTFALFQLAEVNKFTMANLLRGVILVPSLIIAGIYIFHNSIKWKECKSTDKFDSDVAVVASVIPGFGLLYLHKWIKGISMAILFVFFALIFVLSIMYEIFETLTFAIVLTLVPWMMFMIFISYLETEYECLQMGLDRSCALDDIECDRGLFLVVALPLIAFGLALCHGHTDICEVLIMATTFIISYYGIRRDRVVRPRSKKETRSN